MPRSSLVEVEVGIEVEVGVEVGVEAEAEVRVEVGLSYFFVWVEWGGVEWLEKS